VDKRKESQLGIKVACVIASFVLWMYVHGIANPIQPKQIAEIPVILVNDESLNERKLVISPNQEFKVQLNVRGPYNEIKNIKADKFKLTADVSGYALKKGEFKVKVDVKEKPTGDYNILENDLYITIRFDEFITKSIPVKTDLNIKPKSGFIATIPENKITEVQVSGPGEYVNSISYVKGEESQKDVDKDISLNLKLVAYNSEDKSVGSDSIKMQPSTIEMLIPVKKTKSVDVSVKRKGIPNNKDISIRGDIEVTPNKIDIAGDAELLNSINMIETEVIDLSDVIGNRTQEVKLILPQGVTLVNGKGVVSAKITTDKTIQKTYSIDIASNNLGADYTVSNDNVKVSVTIAGIENKLNAVNISDIKGYIDLANLVEGDHTVPIVIKLPEGITLLTTSPQTVKVTITKKNATVTTGTTNVTPTATPKPAQ
jgi:YbbR domain-containing protein